MINVRFKHQGVQLMKEAQLIEEDKLMLEGSRYSTKNFSFDVPVTGTVYGTIMNYTGEYKQYEDKLTEAPYSSPPKAPILYIKPINTYIGDGSPIPMPSEVDRLSAGAALALVVGNTASKLTKENALSHIAGYTIANDISIPHESIYRPAYKEKARDGFCPIGPWIVDRDAVKDPNALKLSVYVNGELKTENDTANLIRRVEELLVDVTEFMTLYEGDVLMAGVPENMPILKVDDTVKIEIEGIGALENKVADENQVMGGKIL